MNIFSLYVSRSQEEYRYFQQIIKKIESNVIENNVQIIHLLFKYNQKIDFIKFHNQPINASIYHFNSLKNESNSFFNTIIYNLDDLIKLYNVPLNGKNIFIYSGHGDGVYLKKGKIKLLRTEDFIEIVQLTVGKADLIIFDCCLQGNINCLNICYNYTKYLIASTSYQSDISILITKSIFKNDNVSILNFAKNVLMEEIQIESSTKMAYLTDFVIYEMNEYLIKLIQLTLNNLKYFDFHKSNVINFLYYKDIYCCFKDKFIDINPLLDKFVKFQRYKPNTICTTKKLKKKNNYSIASKLMIVLKNPTRIQIPTLSDIFYKKNKV